MNSPIVAMLWEQWRLSRVEAAYRLALGIVAGAAALRIPGWGPTVAFWFLLAVNATFYFSIAKLNGGRFMDGYKPGFPLYLLYSRPVPTAAMVGVAMAYDAISCTAVYLVSAALLGFAFGQPLPLLSMIVPLVAYHLVAICVQWSTRNRVIQWVGSTVVFLPFLALVSIRAKSSLQFEFSLLENALMVLAGIVSCPLTVIGVARQRHGGAVTSAARAAASSEPPVWLISLFRFPCPTSSAARAQVWFELRSSGLPILAIGLVMAMLVPVLFAISVPAVPLRPFAAGIPLLLACLLLFAFGGNAFGIRRKQGRLYASSFEATQPSGTAQLASLKVLVRSGCVLIALIAVGMSLWASLSFFSEWGAWADDEHGPMQGLLAVWRKTGEIFSEQTGFVHAAQVVIASLVVATLVAALAVREALRARYPRRVLVGFALLLLWCLALVLLGLAGAKGIVSASLVDAVLRTSRWIADAAVVLTTVYVLWSGFTERVLTLRYVCAALVIWAAFVGALLLLAGMPAPNEVLLLSLLLLPLTASVLAPWSFDRMRHA